MIVQLVVTRCLEHGEGCSLVVCAHPQIAGCSRDLAYAIDFVKGAVLHCIGDWKRVPDGIEFRVKGEEEKKA